MGVGAPRATADRKSQKVQQFRPFCVCLRYLLPSLPPLWDTQFPQVRISPSTRFVSPAFKSI